MVSRTKPVPLQVEGWGTLAAAWVSIRAVLPIRRTESKAARELLSTKPHLALSLAFHSEGWKSEWGKSFYHCCPDRGDSSSRYSSRETPDKPEKLKEFERKQKQLIYLIIQKEHAETFRKGPGHQCLPQLSMQLWFPYSCVLAPACWAPNYQQSCFKVALIS